MTNLEYIKGSVVDYLASLLVYEKLVDDGDYDIEDVYTPFYQTYYIFNKDNQESDLYLTYEDAIEACIEWLNSEK